MDMLTHLATYTYPPIHLSTYPPAQHNLSTDHDAFHQP